MRVFYWTVLVVLSCFISLGLFAQVFSDWQPFQPANLGGTTVDILVDKDNSQKVFAACTTGGLWVSENGGDSWNRVEGLDYSFISCMTQASNGDIYVGTGYEFFQQYNDIRVHRGNGVYKSTDGSMSFEHLAATTPEFSFLVDWTFVNSIATHPDHPEWVYAGFTDGFQMSMDGGETWFTPMGLPSVFLSRCQVVMSSNGTVFAHIGSSLYRATDGENFELISGSELPSFPNDSYVVLATSPSNPNYVYGILPLSGWAYGFGQLLQSTDGGDTWVEVANMEDLWAFSDLIHHNTFPYSQQALTVHPTNPEQIFMAGNFNWTWTADDGWTFLDELVLTHTGHNIRTNFKYVVTIDPMDTDHIYIGSNAGIFKSTDGGSTFELRNEGYHTAQIFGATLWNDSTLLAATHAQGFITMGYESSEPETEFYHYGNATDVFTTHLNPNLFIGNTANGGGIRTADLGYNFISVYDDNADCLPSPSGQIGCYGDGIIDGGAVYRTPSTFMNIGDTLLRYVVGSKDGRVWLTENPLSLIESPYWCVIVDTDDITENQAITSVAISADGDMILAGTDKGRLIRILDVNENECSVGGAADYFIAEFDLGVGNRPIVSIAINGLYPFTVTIALGGQNEDTYLYRSDFILGNDPILEPIQNNLPLMSVYDVIYEQQSASFTWAWGSLGTLLVGTERGLYYSIDHGDSWLPFGSELSGIMVVDIKQVPHPSGDPFDWLLVTSTFGHGVWTYELNTPEFYATVGVENQNLESEVGMSIAPNPAQQQLSLIFAEAPTQPVEVQMVDIHGRKKMERTFQAFEAYELDISDLPDGQYFLKIWDGQQSLVKKVVVSR